MHHMHKYELQVFQKANIIYTESQPHKRHKTEQEHTDECCRLPVTGDSTIVDLLPRTHLHKYFRLVEMLPNEFHEFYPELPKMNPYCIARIVYLTTNVEEAEVQEDLNEYVPKVDLDTAIRQEAQYKRKVLRSIEQRQCHPFYRLPLVQVREC